MRKKIYGCLMLMSLSLTMLGLTGCGVSSEKDTSSTTAQSVTDTSENGNLDDISGENTDLEMGAYEPECPFCGIVAEIPQEYLDMGMYGIAAADPFNRRTFFIVYMGQNEGQDMQFLASVLLVKKEEYEAQLDEGKTLDEIAMNENTELLGENDGYVYLFNREGNISKEGFSAEESSNLEACIGYVDELVRNIKYIPVEEEEKQDFATSEEAFPQFATKDIYGNDVTNELLAGKDLTVVNIWGTFCEPCIGELPELSEWSKNMSENVQLIGLLCDVNSYDDTEQVNIAKEIVEKTGADYTQLIGNDDFTQLLSNVVGVPTTIFIDKNGYMVGEPVMGADVQAYKDFVEGYINGQ